MKMLLGVLLESSRLNAKLALIGAIGVVYEYRKRFAKALVLPLLILTALDIAAKQVDTIAAQILSQIVGLPIFTLFAITIHRLVLLGPQSVPEWGLRSWTKRESMFLVYFISFALMSSIFLSLLLFDFADTIHLLLFLFAGGIFVWATARLSLVFPAISVDEGVSFRLAWQLSAKHQLPLVLVVFGYPLLVALLLAIPIALISLVPFLSVANSLAGLVLTVLLVSALSLAFRQIKRAEYGT